MFSKLLKAIFGTKVQRDVRKYIPIVKKINQLEDEVRKLRNEDFPKKTEELKERYRRGEKDTDLLPYAFALCREAARRTLNMRHFDVQLMGGIVLYEGKIAEMATGEGKTLVATLPVYLNAITGKRTHLVTVNDYLAKRDAEWMGPIYRLLGLKVGYIQNSFTTKERKDAYNSDVTYVTNNEVGFDYLRDNMALDKEDQVLKGLECVIIDEVDFVLIDEARTPLIISGPAEKSTKNYYIANSIIKHLRGRKVTEEELVEAKYKGIDISKGADYLVDEKNNNVVLTEQGIAKCEKLLGIKNLYEDVSSEWPHHITQAIRAHELFKRDVHYIVKDGKVVIVDEFTGRLMPGRRWSDGLHQAIEAKEGLRIAEENQTLATITFQNFFNLYEKKAGMTGTAATEAEEFWKIYKLEVVVIPTNKPVIRIDHPDSVYKTEREKFEAIIRDIEERHKKGQPILVGTRSIEKNEFLSRLLKRKGIKHEVLNAKYHEREADIIAQAGRIGAVTVATNMAGRGTDIMLGGNPDYMAKKKMKEMGYDFHTIFLASEKTPTDDPEILKARKVYEELKEEMKKITDKEHDEVIKLGGLYVLGTERHEARRIDNQLRGRSGRQGDPGESKFYVSLEDELMRLFGGERIKFMMERFGMKDGEEISHPLVTKAIANAQRKVEAMHFDIRKQLLEFDSVLDKQRKTIYSLRQRILEGKELKKEVLGIIENVIDILLEKYASAKDPQGWDIVSLNTYLERVIERRIEIKEDDLLKMKREDLGKEIAQCFLSSYEEREREMKEDFYQMQKFILLTVLDNKWRNHLYELDHLKEGITLRAYGQKDPVVEYKRESFRLFEEMLLSYYEEVVEYIFRFKVVEGRREVKRIEPRREVSTRVKVKKKIGRNDPCPCGSGKKYKKCCGRNL
ncbi:MAG: preprotein translocase subunit SecA [Caldiserica bacterium]|nr:MAG: preprotein translocase subunit SecA [Caldisericota bacterium]